MHKRLCAGTACHSSVSFQAPRRRANLQTLRDFQHLGARQHTLKDGSQRINDALLNSPVSASAFRWHCLNRKVFSLRLNNDPNFPSVAVRLPNMDSRTITTAGSGHARHALLLRNTYPTTTTNTPSRTTLPPQLALAGPRRFSCSTDRMARASEAQLSSSTALSRLPRLPQP